MLKMIDDDNDDDDADDILQLTATVCVKFPDGKAKVCFFDPDHDHGHHNDLLSHPSSSASYSVSPSMRAAMIIAII